MRPSDPVRGTSFVLRAAWGGILPPGSHVGGLGESGSALEMAGEREIRDAGGMMIPDSCLRVGGRAVPWCIQGSG